MMTLHDLHHLLGGAGQLVGDPATRVLRVHSDTRTLQPGDLFVALRGDRFDANDFLPQAREAGAAAALAERGLAAAGLPGVQVPDALAALQQLAGAWRGRLSPMLIAVTGSNGKTTVTQMIAGILRAWLEDTALATQGNFNNHIGVPLTLLRLQRRHRVGVIELGTNHEGEIGQLAALVRPGIALINNAQREHQEFLHGVEAVARENGSVIAALPAHGTLVLPADDAYTPLWRDLAGTRPVRSFALEADADVVGHARWQHDRWALRIEARHLQVDTTLAIAGRHNAKNAVAAAACALAAGAPAEAVSRGLEAFVPVKGRSRALALHYRGRPLTLIDDSYNANPDSVLAAIDVLAELPGPRWLLLGDMAEVGDQGAAVHAEVGRHAAQRGIEALWTFGRASQQASAAAMAGGVVAGRHFDDMAALLDALHREGPAAASVLVKGSHSMRMDRVVQALQEAPHAA